MIVLPIYYTVEYKTKKDKTSLVGMNFYRNSHFQVLNKVKKYFDDIAQQQLRNLVPLTGAYKLTIVVYYKNSASDGSNIAAIAEKHILDSLQSGGIVINDNVKYHHGTTWSLGGVDKLNPRVEIEVIPI